jgi:hypothetical protein
MWRSSTIMYVTVPYNEVLFSILYFFNQPIGSWFWNCPRIMTVGSSHCQCDFVKNNINLSCYILATCLTILWCYSRQPSVQIYVHTKIVYSRVLFGLISYTFIFLVCILPSFCQFCKHYFYLLIRYDDIENISYKILFIQIWNLDCNIVVEHIDHYHAYHWLLRDQYSMLHWQEYRGRRLLYFDTTINIFMYF